MISPELLLSVSARKVVSVELATESPLLETPVKPEPSPTKVVAVMLPSTCNLVEGVSVPMPTSPFWVIVIIELLPLVVPKPI